MTKKYKRISSTLNKDGTFNMLLESVDGNDKILATKCYVKSIEDSTFTTVEEDSLVNMSMSFNYDAIKKDIDDRTGIDNAEH